MKMIEVCSLDFLNNEFFESDIKLADGRIIIKAGEKVTPELILRLYFKKIFTEEILIKEKKKAMCQEALEGNLARELAIKGESSFADRADVKIPKPVVLGADVANAEFINTQNKSEDFVETSFISKNIQQSDIPDDFEISGEQETSDIPSDFKIEEASSPIIEDFNNKTGEDEATLSYSDADLKPDEKLSDSESTMISFKTNEDEQPKLGNLKFDAEQAAKMADLAVETGKLLDMGYNDLEDLRNEALNCNIGIVHFNDTDLNNKNFEIYKAAESAEMVQNEGKLSDKVVEAIRLYPNKYESNSFSLDKNIPHCNIIGIIYYYQKMLDETGSKADVLHKMLRYGGTKFNIFVLHKFIRKMREIHD